MGGQGLCEAFPKFFPLWHGIHITIVNQVFHSFDLSTVVRIWIVSCLGFEGFVVCPRCAVENLERCFFCLISVDFLILHGRLIIIISRVVDPYSFFPDPDPIQIQGFNDQKLKKNYS